MPKRRAAFPLTMASILHIGDPVTACPPTRKQGDSSIRVTARTVVVLLHDVNEPSGDQLACGGDCGQAKCERALVANRHAAPPSRSKETAREGEGGVLGGTSVVDLEQLVRPNCSHCS